MSSHREEKVCAAAVMIFWMATVIAAWGVESAARAAIEGTACRPSETRLVVMKIAAARTNADVEGIIGRGGTAEESCLQRATIAATRRDSFLVPAYGLLTMSLFWLVASRRAGGVRRGLRALGVLLSVVVMAADFSENALVLRLLDQPMRSDDATEQLAALSWAATAKWAGLAVSCVILGFLWQRRSRWTLVLRLLALTAGTLLIAGFVVGPMVTGLGVLVLGLFWSAALTGAVRRATDLVPDGQ